MRSCRFTIVCRVSAATPFTFASFLYTCFFCPPAADARCLYCCRCRRCRRLRLRLCCQPTLHPSSPPKQPYLLTVHRINQFAATTTATTTTTTTSSSPAASADTQPISLATQRMGWLHPSLRTRFAKMITNSCIKNFTYR